MEINPQTIVTSDDPVNSYYCNHIYYPYYYQQTFGEMQCLRAFCDTSVVWYGEDFYNFCFLSTVTKSINVVEGSEYVQIYLGYVPSTSETGSCFDCTEYFVTTDNLFLQPDGECTYIKFNETKPTDTAFVKIIVTDYSDEVYTFNVFVVNPVFTLFDYTYDHNLKRNNEITLDVCASPQFGYSLNLPDTTKYNVEIITGSDFGNLVNNTTSDSGQVLNDLSHNYGCLDQIILRTNDQIQADSEIKIRVRTSDPSIEPIEITFTNLLVVNIVPEIIAPGDTAQIIPKLKNPDGSLSDFPIEQTFEIGMLDGCALGMIKTATDSGLYVDAALQPFYFIADTGAVEGTVKLRVGVIEGMSSSSLLNNNLKSRKSENQKKKSSASDNRREAKSFIDGGVIGEYCFLGDLYSAVTGDANVVVGNVCATLPKCTENNAGKKPNFEIMDFPDGTDGKYKCNNVSGITYMLWSENEKKLFLPIEIENCCDEHANVIQFGIKNDLMTLRAIVTACEDVIVNQGYTILYNTTELKTKVPQNLRALSQLYSDLDIFLDYFTNENPSSPFYPIELAWEHEFQHKRNYVNEIFNVVNKDFDYLDYSRLDVTCNKYSELNDVVNEMKSNFEKRFSYFEKESIKFQFKVWGKKDGTPKEIENYRKNEINTHNAIAKKVIDKYKTEIKKLILSLPK